MFDNIKRKRELESVALMRESADQGSLDENTVICVTEENTPMNRVNSTLHYETTDVNNETLQTLPSEPAYLMPKLPGRKRKAPPKHRCPSTIQVSSALSGGFWS